jgi:hypothetical protein
MSFGLENRFRRPSLFGGSIGEDTGGKLAANRAFFTDCPTGNVVKK